ncbi:ABC transporter ATP-binding protein [Spiroplasma ixodetis]|uniref:ABC transporter domain-containing protein n=1 Tax=Spiroplasma ixodetis TaxID=2141 RepID=A0ABM8BZ01_9MOLU|nr:ABC transporter ATP-binding protein [Spiroplasma ixodetis]BDT05131.1 hypothetical protein SHM_27770 [Spiroplasma ixodetis]
MSTNDKNKILINVQNYSKKFKKFHMNNISFTVFEGTIHALVGRSGSGKSVLLKSIIGAIPKSNYEGLITINGYKAGTTFSKNSLGYSLNIENFPQGLSAYNFLKFLGKTTIISESKLLVNLERLLKNFGLWESRNKSLNSFSSGMKNRIMLIIALAHDPNLVILNEPGANLDSESRKFFTSVLQDLKKEGKTILLTTHMIDETKDIIDNCTIIEHGKLIYTGPIDKFGVGKIFVLKTSNNLVASSLLSLYNFQFKYNKDTDSILIKLIDKNYISQLNFILSEKKIVIYDLHEKELDLFFINSFF